MKFEIEPLIEYEPGVPRKDVFAEGVYFDNGDTNMLPPYHPTPQTYGHATYKKCLRNTNGMLYHDQHLLEYMTSARDIAKMKAMVAKADCDAKWTRCYYKSILRALSGMIYAHHREVERRLSWQMPEPVVEEQYRPLLQEIIDAEEYYTLLMMKHTESAQRATFSEELPVHASEDTGVSDATLSMLVRRIKNEKHLKGKPELSINQLFDNVLDGYRYVTFGKPPTGYPDVVDPIRRIVVFADDFIVVRQKQQVGIDGYTFLKPSNGRAGEHGRVYRRTHEPPHEEREWL